MVSPTLAAVSFSQAALSTSLAMLRPTLAVMNPTLALVSPSLAAKWECLSCAIVGLTFLIFQGLTAKFEVSEETLDL